MVTGHARTDRRTGSTTRAALWMVGLSVLLFWLPVVGPAIAGFVGGRKATTVGRAMVAAFAPAIVTALLVAAVLFLFDLEVLGLLAGLGFGVAVLVQDVPLFIGAAAGAAVTPDR